jgi:transposase-like protein
MVTITVHCPHCGSEELVCHGQAPNGKQKYRCRACKRQSHENPTPHAYPEERREEILRAYEKRSSLRGLERIFGVSRTSLIAWIKKRQPSCQRFRETVIAPDATDADATVLELDELWSFVMKKTNQA